MLFLTFYSSNNPEFFLPQFPQKYEAVIIDNNQKSFLSSKSAY